MRGFYSIIGSIMLMFAGMKQRFVRWLLADTLPAPVSPPPKLLNYDELPELPEDERQAWINNVMAGLRIDNLAFGANTIRMGNPPSIGANFEGIAWDTDSVLNAPGQFGMDTATGELQWHDGGQQRSIYDTGGIDFNVGGGKVTNLGAPTVGGDATTKTYVDNLIAGGTWLAPACVNGYIGNRTVAEINALGTPSSGTAVVATDAGTPTEGASDALVAGDLVEFNGTSWLIIEGQVGGFPPNGTRAIISTAETLVGPLADGVDDGKIAEWDGTLLTPSLITPSNGEAVLINCDNAGGGPSVFENNAYSLQGAVPAGVWTLFQAATPNHENLNGLTGTGTDGDAGHTQFVQLSGRDTPGYQTVAGVSSAYVGGGFLYLYGNDSGFFTKDTDGEIIIASDTSPIVDSQVDLGATAARWNVGYFDQLNVNANGGGGVGITMALGADILADTTGSNVGAAGAPFGTIYGNAIIAENFLLGGDATTEDLTIGGNNSGVDNGSIIVNAGTTDLYPSDDVTTGLGRAANRWTTVFANTFDAAVSIVPESDNTTTMGTAGIRFADLHVFLPTHYGNMTMSGDLDYVPSGANIGQIGTTALPFKQGAFGDGAGTLNALDLYSGVEVHGDYDIFPTTDNNGRVGIGGVFATGTLTGSTNFAAGDSVNAGGKTYLFQNPLSNVNGYVLVGADLNESLDNLAAAINNADGTGDPPGAGTQYAENTTANGAVTALVAGNSMTVTALVIGTAGNGATTTVGVLNTGDATWGAASTSGGVDPFRFKEVNAVQVVSADIVMRDPETGGRNANWRLVEQAECIIAINQLSGKQYKMGMMALHEEDYIEPQIALRIAA